MVAIPHQILNAKFQRAGYAVGFGSTRDPWPTVEIDNKVYRLTDHDTVENAGEKYLVRFVDNKAELTLR